MSQTLHKASSGSLSELDNFGKFQFYQYCFISAPLVIVSIMNVNFIFVAGETNYRCKMPVCDNENSTVERPRWWPKDLDEKCMRPMFSISDNETCTNKTVATHTQECNEWIYENENSIVSELNLACQEWKTNLVGTIHNAGMILSMTLMGWTSDRFGRKPSLILCSVGGWVGLAKVTTKNYFTYLTIEGIESILSSGLYTVAIVMMVEVGGRKQRVLAGITFAYSCYTGEVIFAFVAIAVPYWKHLILITYTPAILFLFTGFFIRESIRWQVFKGFMKEARNTLALIVKFNKLDHLNDDINNISDEELRSKLNIEKQERTETLRDILGSKEIVVRLAVSSFCFFTTGFVYYGLVVMSVLLPGNKYYNFALSSLTSFPGDLLAYYMFNRFGRRLSLQGGFLACAILLLLQAQIFDAIAWLKILVFLSGKLAISLCFTGIFTYSLELFPTSVRGSLIGLANVACRIGSMLSPLTPLLGTQIKMLPALLFASTSVVSGLLLFLTPETKCLPLFDTIAQIENYEGNIKSKDLPEKNNHS